MPRPLTTTRSTRRLLGLLMVIASVVLFSPSAAHANRGPSPYAFEDPSTPFTEVDGNNSGTTKNPGVIPQTTNVLNPVGGSKDTPLLPAVVATDTPAGGTLADPVVDPVEVNHPGLALTGAAGLTNRIALAMMLVAIGFLAKEASGRRRTLAG